MGAFERDRHQLADRLGERRKLNDATVRAMKAVPRHAFVPEDSRDSAYEDRPLPIGEGQTISAPHMVAIMTDLLELESGVDVLEVGTGCGYHAAVTAELAGPEHVHSVEYHPELAERARETLAATGYGGVSVRVGDGREGWPAHAPYGRAYLTCSAGRFPPTLLEQLAVGGIVLGPLGNGQQVLVRGRKREDGSLERTEHGHVRFVPLR